MNDSHDHALAGPAARRVLAERKNAGIKVTLLWSQDTNAVSVLVHDDGTGDQFELSVENRRQCARHVRAYVCVRRMAWRRPSARRPQRRGSTSGAVSPACNNTPGAAERRRALTRGHV